MGNLANLAGKKGLEPLPKDAPPELHAERAALMRKLNNVPEKPDGYGIKKPDTVPDEQWNGEYVNGVLGILHKHHASPELVKELVGFDQTAADGMRSKGEAAQAQARERELATLKQAFGNDYEKRLALAARAAKTLDLDVSDPTIGNNAKVIQALARVADMVSEDKLVAGDDSVSPGLSDRERALSIVNNEADPLYKAYHDTEHPQHAHAVRERSRFNQRYHEALARSRARQSAA